MGAARERGLWLAVAESCTGGLIAARITSVPGASAVFKGGIVCYANSAKQGLLDVPEFILEQKGAVSLACAEAMATGARSRLESNVAIAVTGIAGPGGGTSEKPVGLVCFGVADARQVYSENRTFSGDRATIRRQAADHGLRLALLAVEKYATTESR